MGVAVQMLPKIFRNDASIENRDSIIDLQKLANAMNERCPIVVESITQLDNAIALSNNTLEYNFTILNADKSDGFDTSAFKEVKKTLAVNNINTNPQLEKLRSLNVNFSYLYRDSSGNYICRVLIAPEDYKS